MERVLAAAAVAGAGPCQEPEAGKPTLRIPRGEPSAGIFAGILLEMDPDHSRRLKRLSGMSTNRGRGSTIDGAVSSPGCTPKRAYKAEKMHTSINSQNKLRLFSDTWSPKIIARINDYHLKLVKIQGQFVWHAHPETDEVFIVLKGAMDIDFRDGKASLIEGEYMWCRREWNTNHTQQRNAVCWSSNLPARSIRATPAVG
jgi:hypothetical protein